MPKIRKFSSSKIFHYGWLRFLGVVAVAAVFLAGCGSDDDAEPEAPTTTSAAVSSAVPTSSAAPAPTTTTAPPPQLQRRHLRLLSP